MPDELRVRGEARSDDLARLEARCAHMRACFENALDSGMRDIHATGE